MSKISLSENQLITLIENLVIEAKKDKKFIQKAEKKIEAKGTKGSFSEWCGGKVTKECIDRGLKSKDASIIKKANFAKNIKGYKGAKKD